MSTEKLQNLREKLNNMIENGSNYQDILKVSEELDGAIASFMDNKFNVNAK